MKGKRRNRSCDIAHSAQLRVVGGHAGMCRNPTQSMHNILAHTKGICFSCLQRFQNHFISLGVGFCEESRVGFCTNTSMRTAT